MTTKIEISDWAPDLIFGAILIYLTVRYIPKLDYKVLFSFTIFLITLGKISYNVDKRLSNISFRDWVNGKSFSSRSVLIGLGTGIFFGLMDNIALLFGLDALDSKFVKLPFGKSSIIRSGYGNALADTLSAFSGTFAGKLISNITGLDSTPIWSDALGTLIGCLLGMYIPKVIFKVNF